MFQQIPAAVRQPTSFLLTLFSRAVFQRALVTSVAPMTLAAVAEAPAWANEHRVARHQQALMRQREEQLHLQWACRVRACVCAQSEKKNKHNGGRNAEVHESKQR
jgi:hypothetical protein